MDGYPLDIRWRRGSTTPVGPAFLPRLVSGQAFRGNAATFLLENAAKYGDLVQYTMLGRTVLQFNHPELVQEMLVRDAGHHHRNLVMQRGKAVLGEGLLTSEGSLHMRQRRLAQPAFHRQRIAAYGEVISGYTAEMTALWPREGGRLDLRAEMLLLALRITGKTLFDTNVEAEVGKIAAAVDSFQGFLPLAFLPFSEAIQRLPIPAMMRIRRGRKELDKLIYGMIRERRADPVDRGDLLSMLIASVDSETDGGGMDDRQVRDECLTVLLAGHETTANALSFCLWLLAENAGAQEELAAECRAALGGRVPEAGDYGRLGMAERVFAEAMRLYPPVWVTARTAAEEYAYRGMRIREGTILVAPQFAVQRDARFFREPARFDPSRFTAEAKAGRPKFAYFPFGAGSRQCIGEGLAWMEGVLRWRRWFRIGAFRRWRGLRGTWRLRHRSRCGLRDRCGCRSSGGTVAARYTNLDNLGGVMERETTGQRISPMILLGFAATLVVLAYATRLALFVAPTEATMGDIQRIFYYHVPSNILAEIFPYINFVASGVYLYFRHKNPERAMKADALALAAAEMTVVFCSIGLASGMLWARPVWGIWWTWDARLTTFFILWLLYVSYLMLRRFSSTGQTQTLAAILSVFAAVDVPIVFMSIRWWRTQHPAPVFGGDGKLDASFYPAFLWNCLGWAMWGGLVCLVRYKLERRRQGVEEEMAFQALEA